jgi:hypothetical protein
VEGQNAINTVRLHRARDPVVQVLRGDEPVAGASVTFLLPASGPGVQFADGSLSQTVQTDSSGMGRATGLRPNALAGPFRIRVAASWRGATALVVVDQTNAEPAVSSGRTKKILILALGGGAAAGVIAALAGGKSGGGQTSASTITAGAATVTAGTPTLGPPH